MPSPRTTIDSPLTIDFSFDPSIEPLKFAVQRASETSPGETIHPDGHFARQVAGGFTELNLRLEYYVDVEDLLGVLYIVPLGPDLHLLAACLEQVPEPTFKFATGADFGDQIVPLIATHWPDVYRQLLASQDTSMSERMLCNFVTATSVQWVVADALDDRELSQLAPDLAVDLLVSAMQTFGKMAKFPISLPGTMEVLGGPDRVSRILKGTSSVLGAVENIADIAALFSKW